MFRFTDRDTITFFLYLFFVTVLFTTGLPVADDMIQFVVRGDGRVTGEAFVSFGSTSDSEVSKGETR